MGSHCALYVDAGYLLASVATRVTGTSLRSAIHVDYPLLVKSLAARAESMSTLPVLRSYWYDSARDGVPDAQQNRIGELDGVKLRLGRFGMDGQQKGVDLRIGLDLVNHARRRTAEVFFLVSGDDDLSEAVEEAQEHGVRVVVLAVPTRDDRAHGVSRHLGRVADSVALADGPSIDAVVVKVEPPSARPEDAAPENDAVAQVDTQVFAAHLSTRVIPTPNDLFGRTRPQPKAPPRSVIAYSSTSRGSGGYGFTEDSQVSDFDENLIRSVAARVLEAFDATATIDERSELLRAKPSIPPDVDRALLTDLADALGIYDVPEPAKYRGRQLFWELADGEQKS